MSTSVSATPTDLEAALARDAVRAALFSGPEPTPRRVGRYEIEHRLGAGGMGVVFAARDPALGRRVAIKLLHPDDRDDERRNARLRREAEALARLNHPHIVVIYEVGEHHGRVYIAMELVDGETLRAWATRESREPAEVLDVFRRIGEGLEAAHRAGLVHRDFKPDNVLIGADGRPRILDFGLVRAAPSDDSPGALEAESVRTQLGESITRTGTMMGTVAYMAPEQHLGRTASAASDQFSYCVCLWEALYGERPFAGDSATAIAQHVVYGRPRPAPHRGVPRWLHEVLLRGLAADPGRRFADMTTLLSQLQGRASRRPRLLAGAAGAVAVGGVLMIGTGGDARQCDRAGAPVAAIWNAEARRDVEQALTEASPTVAAARSRRVERTLDAYAEDWTRLQAEVCEADDSADDAAPPSDRDATTACLRRGLVQFDALVRVLRAADREIAGKAEDAASKLPPPARCRDANADPNDAGPSSDRERVLLERLDRLRPVMQAGDRSRVGHEAAEVAAAAREAGATRIEADASMMLGWTRVDHGDIAGAEELFRRAYFVASEHHHPDLALDASIAVLAMAGGERADYPQAQRWYGHARALAERSATAAQHARLEYTWATLLHARGELEEAFAAAERARAFLEDPASDEASDDSGSLRYDISSLTGNLLRERGELDQAREVLADAVSQAEAQLGPDHPMMASLLNNQAIGELRAGNLPQARALFERVLSIQEANLAPTHSRLADGHSNLGLTCMRQGELDAALEHYRRALEILESAVDAGHPKLGMAHAQVGNLLRQMGQPEAGERHLRAAVGLLEAAPEQRPLYVQVLQMYGAALLDQGRYDEIFEQQQRILQMRQQMHGPVHPDVAETLHWIGDTLGDQGKYEQAFDYLDRALAMFEETLGPDDLMSANTRYRIAVHESRRGNFAVAEQHLVRAIEAIETSRGPDDVTIGHFSSSLGTALSAQGRVADARAAFDRAIRVFTTTLGPDDPQVAYVLGNLAISLRKEGRAAEALTLQLRALTILERALAPDHIELSYAYHNLGQIYAALRRHAEAAEHLRRAVEIRQDSAIAPALLADSKWRLAESLAKLRRKDEAVAFARAARESYAAAGEGFEADVERVDAWLARRG